MKNIPGFKEIHVEFLKRNQFFFFPNGRTRMVAEQVHAGVSWTTIKATSPSGRTYKRDIVNCTWIYVYE